MNRRSFIKALIVGTFVGLVGGKSVPKKTIVGKEGHLPVNGMRVPEPSVEGGYLVPTEFHAALLSDRKVMYGRPVAIRWTNTETEDEVMCRCCELRGVPYDPHWRG